MGSPQAAPSEIGEKLFGNRGERIGRGARLRFLTSTAIFARIDALPQQVTPPTRFLARLSERHVFTVRAQSAAGGMLRSGIAGNQDKRAPAPIIDAYGESALFRIENFIAQLGGCRIE